jgi:hypothetical protein
MSRGTKLSSTMPQRVHDHNAPDARTEAEAALPEARHHRTSQAWSMNTSTVNNHAQAQPFISSPMDEKRIPVLVSLHFMDPDHETKKAVKILVHVNLMEETYSFMTMCLFIL